MGLLDRFRRVQAVDAVRVDTADYYGAWRLANQDYLRIMGLDPAQMWATQPYLRIVVNFMARNIAQLALQTFQRVSDTDRQRLRTGGIADALRSPNRATTAYELVYGLVADKALYDTAYWLIAPGTPQPITRLPVPWVTPKGGDALGPEFYEVRKDDKGQAAIVPPEQVLAFHGWHPGSLVSGSSPLNALKEVLAEQVQAAKYRELVWRRGGKVGAALSRPAGAPRWSPEAREQFKKDWESNFSGEGPRVGGTPLLEDGMTLTRVDFNAHEMEFIEGARLALNTVASAYHIPPPMVGLLENANYSNVREFRKMLYGDTLGPVIAEIEDRINTFAVPLFDTRANVYVEFNVDEKLQGNFDEQATALQSAVGRPWMTADEARALRNMPALGGDADELVTPLNVLVGGQASPNDSGTQNELPKSLEPGTKAGNLFLLKARATQRQSEQVAAVLRKFFARQGKAVLAAIAAGDTDWWDARTWDAALTKDLHAVALSVTEVIGKAEAEGLGFTADDYDPDLTVNYLQAVSEKYARRINESTKSQLDEALTAEEPDPVSVFEQAKGARSDGGAVGVTTFLAGFAGHEAAKQIARTHDVTPTKTWVTGPNPRPEHAAMDGVTVSLDEDFPDGSKWPGSGPDSAGCNCSLLLSID